ncbi:MAG: response regulator transcription factor [Holosporales bacterium]|jgi:two-component system phosphate regulon response regulator OmpR|nr:response regulator transcription factor [Holosporales bacterium]
MTADHSVLVIDDDKRLTTLLLDVLKLHNLDAVGVNSAAEARAALVSHTFDIIVIDWMMPQEDGMEFIINLRRYDREIPVIMLTAMSDIDNKLEGFKNGVDDYITKPFEGKELVARIKSIMKRCKNKTSNEEIILRFGECEFNVGTGHISHNSRNIELSSWEVTLLKTLCMRPNQPFSREELSKKLDFIVSDRTIDVQITRLRKKIGDNTKNPAIIKTIRHIGYAINIES